MAKREIEVTNPEHLAALVSQESLGVGGLAISSSEAVRVIRSLIRLGATISGVTVTREEDVDAAPE